MKPNIKAQHGDHFVSPSCVKIGKLLITRDDGKNYSRSWDTAVLRTADDTSDLLQKWHFALRTSLLSVEPRGQLTNEAPDPVSVSLVGANTVMFAPNDIAHLIEQFGLVLGCLDR